MRFSPLVIITTLAAGLATAAPAPAHPADLIARNATATLTHETVIVVSLHTSKDKWSHLPIKTQTDCRVIDLDGHVTDVIILFGYRCKFWS
ncbi:hypothetical protein BDW74DRAFT_175666 [Aspergillus multicolor]|uniref:uncharacterized protein n=1 Tax=Aspergillus multicolor TaxID=41759 RepID=UPI003CCCD19A